MSEPRCTGCVNLEDDDGTVKYTIVVGCPVHDVPADTHPTRITLDLDRKEAGALRTLLYSHIDKYRLCRGFLSFDIHKRLCEAIESAGGSARPGDDQSVDLSDVKLDALHADIQRRYRAQREEAEEYRRFQERRRLGYDCGKGHHNTCSIARFCTCECHTSYDNPPPTPKRVQE